MAPIYYANAPRLRERTLGLVDAADPPPRVLVLDLGAVPDIDVTAIDLLADFDAVAAFADPRTSPPPSA